MPMSENKRRAMPLLTLDPNKPPSRSPHKRTTPPQSPPTPHKIELIDDDHRNRLLRSSISSDNGGSSSSSTSSEEGICGTNVAKKQLFTNGCSSDGALSNGVQNHVVIKQRTSPRKAEETSKNNAVVVKEKGPKKKLSFVDADKSTNTVKAFMPIRRSERRPKKNQTADITQRLSEAGPDDSKLPLKVCNIVGKNRGVVPTKKLFKGEFVVEYAGELIEHSTAEERENRYAMDISKGCYMYYFKTNGKHYCIDATTETGRLGRLVNHSRLQPNCCTKVVMVDKVPRLVLIAKTDIEAGTELLYDYGDRSKESLIAHPWLAK